MGLAHSPRIVTDGLVLCLDAANSKSYPSTGTSWTDLTDSTTIGTLTNGPTFNSSNGGTIVFDGVDDVVSVGNPTKLQLTTAITVTSWIYPQSLLRCQIVSKNDNSGYRFRVGSLASTPTITFFDRGGTNSLTSDSSIIPITIDTWFYVCATGDSSGLNLYINSVLTGSNQIAYNPGAGAQSGDFLIGSNIASERFNGRIATINVYNRALSPAEIQQNFNALRGRFGV